MEKRVLESSIQSDIIKSLKRDGWYVIRMRSVSPTGTPDILAIKNSTNVFIEVNREGGKVSPLQKITHKQIRMAGDLVFVAHSYKEFQYLLKVYKLLNNKTNL